MGSDVLSVTERPENATGKWATIRACGPRPAHVHTSGASRTLPGPFLGTVMLNRFASSWSTSITKRSIRPPVCQRTTSAIRPPKALIRPEELDRPRMTYTFPRHTTFTQVRYLKWSKPKRVRMFVYNCCGLDREK
jgi:hypothetical protein